MTQVDLLYYVAGAMLVLMSQATTAVGMRLCHLAASGMFTLYGVLAEVWPVAIMNALMVLLHVVRLSRKQSR